MRHTHIPEPLRRGEGEHGADLADDLLRIATNYGAENIAAVFVEPIAGSTGVLCAEDYLKRLRALCDQLGVLLCSTRSSPASAHRPAFLLRRPSA